MFKFISNLFKKEESISAKSAEELLDSLEYMYTEEFVKDPRNFDFDGGKFMVSCMQRCDSFIERFEGIKKQIFSQLGNDERSNSLRGKLNEISEQLSQAHSQLNSNFEKRDSLSREEQLACYNSTTDFRESLRKTIQNLKNIYA